MNRLTLTFLLLLPLFTLRAAPDLSGYWVLDHGPVPEQPLYTEAGQSKIDGYDLLVDDPMLRCIPPSVARVYSHPGTPFEIIQNEDTLVFRYELFDLTRTVVLAEKENAQSYSTVDTHDVRHATLGISRASYQGDVLAIETENYDSGIIFTSSGVPQSESTHTLERYNKEDNRLYLTITYTDPSLYEESFDIYYEFRQYPENELLEYGCLLENASYDE